jgi:hypothetical protein
MDKDTGANGGFWTGVVDIARTPSPMARPAKRARQDNGSTSAGSGTISSHTLSPESMDKAWIEQGIIDESWLDGEINGFDPTLLDDSINGFSNGINDYGTSDLLRDAQVAALRSGYESAASRKTVMQTGCIPCL